jgi:hypothetical protein
MSLQAIVIEEDVRRKKKIWVLMRAGVGGGDGEGWETEHIRFVMRI